MDKIPANITISISTGTVIKSLLFIVLLVLLYTIRDLVLVVLTAIVLASAIEPAAKWFMKYKIPRIPSVLFVYLIVFTSLFGAFYMFTPFFLEQATGLFATLPQYLESLSGSAPIFGDVATQGGVTGFSFQSAIDGFRATLDNLSTGFVTAISFVFGGLFSFILIIVFSFYFAVQETGIDDFLRIITPIKQHDYIIGLWERSRIKIGLWMQGQLILALVIGILTALVLAVFQVPYFLVLALLAMVFEIIPIFGPVLAAIPAVMVATLDGGLTFGLLVVGIYVIIQQFENHLIYPVVVTKVVGVPPLLVILALIIGAQLAGFLGIILAVPAAAVIQEFVKDIQKHKGRLAQQSAQN